MAYKTPEGSWRVEYTNPLTGKRATKTFKSRADALHFEADVESGIDVTTDLMASTRSFADLCKHWLDKHAPVGLGDKQQYESRRRIELYLIPHLGEIRVRDLKPSHLTTLKMHLVKHGGVKKSVIKPKTINLILDQAKTVANFCVAEELIARNPFEKVPGLEVGEQPVKVWTGEQLRLFLNHCRRLHRELAQLVEFSALSGLRRGELMALKRGDVDFDNATVNVSDAYCVRKKGDKGKTKEANVVTIPVDPRVLVVIAEKRLMRHDERLFYRPLVQHACRKIQRIARIAGVPAIRFHDVRHTYGTQVARVSGGDIPKMMRLLRHKTPTMSLRYTHLDVEDLRDIAKGVGDMVRKAPTEVPLDDISKNGSS